MKKIVILVFILISSWMILSCLVLDSINPHKPDVKTISSTQKQIDIENKIIENPEEEKEKNNTEDIQFYISTVWPTEQEVVDSAFGPRIKSSDNNRYDFHRGIDIHGDLGEDIYSIADGKVVDVWLEGQEGSPYPNGGTVVVIKHDFANSYPFHNENIDFFYTYYLHLNSVNVAEEEEVNRGAIIGTMGKTGTTDLVHLHFELRIGASCSIEYQLDNPANSCGDEFDSATDPHVNPLLFLDYDNKNTIRGIITTLNPLTVEVTALKEELDFNRIEVISESETIVIDFNLREGINPNDIDDNDYHKVIINPEKINSNYLKTEFIFSDIEEYNQIILYDIFGNKVQI